MKDKLKKLLYVFLLMLLILVLFYPKSKNQAKIQNVNAIIESTKKIQKMGSLSVPYQKIVKNKMGNFCSITLVIKGIAMAYLDLENIKQDDIKIKDDTVYITIPSIRLDVSIQSHRVFKENIILCDRIELINETLKKGKLLILEDLEKDSIREIAMNNARRILKELIRGFGFKEVIFIVDTTKIL